MPRDRNTWCVSSGTQATSPSGTIARPASLLSRRSAPLLCGHALAVTAPHGPAYQPSRHPHRRCGPAGEPLVEPDPNSTRLVRLSYLLDITQAILYGWQPCDLTAEKLLKHSRLPGTISGPCSALDAPDPNTKIYARSSQQKPDFIGTGVAFSPTPSAALRYWNMARQSVSTLVARHWRNAVSLFG
jgi:hypothetical protein